MSTLLWILGSTGAVSLVGFIGIFLFLVREPILKKIIKTLVAFSVGVLLGGSFFHLLAEALESLPAQLAFGITIIGFLSFFILEEYLHWHHCKEGECPVQFYTYLLAAGDALHNFIDGLVLAGVFILSVPLGLTTALMIIGHEVPQELGVFGVLISGGLSKSRALLYSFLAQVTCVLGGILGFVFFYEARVLAGYLLPFAAGGFLYIAASDLLPGMHKTQGREKIYSFLWLCAGVVFMLALKLVFPRA